VTPGPSTALFRDAVSRFATGIAVVSCRVNDIDHAMTANSFTSVSLEPLLVLVCVERESRFHDAIVASDQWAVSLLHRSAEPTSRWLATKGRPLEGQLASVPHHRGPVTGSALIDGALATLECRTYARHGAGDHDIVVGEVIGAEVGAESKAGEPLLYFRRGYHDLGGSLPGR
jgi:flavin reductase